MDTTKDVGLWRYKMKKQEQFEKLFNICHKQMLNGSITYGSVKEQQCQRIKK